MSMEHRYTPQPPPRWNPEEERKKREAESRRIVTPRGLRIGTIGGAPIRLDWSWWLFALLIIWAFADLFVTGDLNQPAYMPWLLSTGFALIMLITVLVHELSHAIVAQAFGWKVHDVSVNLWGGLTTFDEGHSGRQVTPGRSLWVALAGPLSNIVLALLGTGASYLWIDPSPGPARLLAMGVYANWLIAGFNLLPGFPLDGGRLVESAVWKVTGSREKGVIAAGWAGRILVLVLVFAVVGYPLMRGYRPSLTMLIVLLLIGSMMWSSASAAIREGRQRLRIARLDLRTLIRPVTLIDENATLQEATGLIAQWFSSAQAVPNMLVTTRPGPDGSMELTGIVDGYALSQIPPHNRNAFHISAFTLKVDPTNTVDINADPQQLVKFVENFRGTMGTVIDSSTTPHTIIGAVMYEDINRAITTTTPGV